MPNNASRQRGRTNSTNVQYGQRADITADAINRYKSGQTECKYYRNWGTFKLIDSKNGPTTFLPLGSNLGGKVDERINSKGENRKKEHLTVKQANYI